MHPNRRLQSGRDGDPPGYDDPLAFLFIPEEIRWITPELRDLFDLSDPDIEYVADSIKLLKIAGLDVEDPEILKLAIQGGHARAARENDDTGLLDQQRRERQEQREAGFIRNSDQLESNATVYYIRVGNRCKIGYTRDFQRRMNALMPEEILATEVGGPILESKRHEQFKDLRSHGKEWFRYERVLVEHVQALQAARG